MENHIFDPISFIFNLLFSKVVRRLNSYIVYNV